VRRVCYLTGTLERKMPMSNPNENVQNEGSKPDLLKKKPGEKSQDERTMEKFKENDEKKNESETITTSTNNKLY
jgi:hypothetical protein